MGRSIYAIFIFIIFFSFCASKKDYIKEVYYLKYGLPKEYKRTGLISSSTYQVYFQIRASNYVEGLKIAKKEVIPLALEYLLQEPFVYVNITYNGKQQIKKLIEKKGKIVYFKRVSEEQDIYDVVFHITDYDLRNQFKYIK
ncbi:MAG: hypothetical protein KatS3mg129_2956 [Leptospiraceae bacterium]|nr:MAG: hypothetical protein KatS3mg129_2956 [Leptospiraceae bacterium]